MYYSYGYDSSFSTIVIILSIVIGIFFSCIWGWAVNKILSNKGYQESWFWWGFFFGFLPLLVALTKPDNPYKHINTFTNEQRYNGHMNSNDWRCSCGKLNASYINTCSCGISKPTYSLRYNASSPNQSDWKCSCGKVNPSYTARCVCGKTKREIENSNKEKTQEPQNLNEMQKIEALKGLKELLDNGAITIDEYELKKKKFL